MKVRAAVLREMGRPAPFADSRPLMIETVELDPPGAGELLVKVRAAGLCHSDLSVIDGSRPRVMPMVLGHEARSEERRVGKECVSTCRSRWSTYHQKKKRKQSNQQRMYYEKHTHDKVEEQ